MSDPTEYMFAVSSIWGSSSPKQKHRLEAVSAVGEEEALGIHLIHVRADLGDDFHLQGWLIVCADRPSVETPSNQGEENGHG